VEVGADEQVWTYDSVEGEPAHEKLLHHIKPHTPEWAAPICDVKADTIRRIANEFLAHAHIGETIEVSGRMLPFRPVAVMLVKSVNNGWGAYECVWGRTIVQVLVGGLEVPGGPLGSTSPIVGPEQDRMPS